MTDPAIGLSKEADDDEAWFRPHVEPVQGRIRNRQQIALLAADLIDLGARPVVDWSEEERAAVEFDELRFGADLLR